jgi:hypothetical protein
MGAFFTNIQVSTSSFEKTGITEKIIEYIVHFNAEAGFIRVDGEEEADKTVIVSLPNDSNWLSIYDEEMEDQGSKKLNRLSSGISKQFKTTALSVLVNDSDSMYVGLNINGTLKDSLSNLSKKIDFDKSKPDFWKDILLNNYSFEDIKIAWQKKIVFVEDFLTEFAKFIDLDASRLLTGYEYLSEEKPNEGIKLNFIHKDKKKTADLGLTKFSMIAGSGLVDVKKGEKQDTEWIMTNQGTFSNGLDLIVAGECIEKELLIPEIAKLSYMKYKSEHQNEFFAPFIETVSTTGEKIFYARIEDIYIPKGFKPAEPMSPKESKRYGKIWYDPAIRFNISFIGGEDGNGDFEIFFSPLVNRQEGSYCASLMKDSLENWMSKDSL